MASWDDVREIALALPESEERLSRERCQWRIDGRLFAWERPLRRKEIEELGERAPDGPILGARVEHLGAKEALLASDSRVFFTTPHFDNHALDPRPAGADLARRPRRGDHRGVAGTCAPSASCRHTSPSMGCADPAL